MTSEKGDELHNLTFSQREGKTPLPGVMKLGHAPEKFRQLAWFYIDRDIKSQESFFDEKFYGDDFDNHGIGLIFWSYQFQIQLKPHDEIPAARPPADRRFSREILLEGEYHDVLTFVEYILRHSYCSKKLYGSLIKAFEKSPIAYFVEKINGQPTLIPRINKESGEATRKSIQVVQDNGMDSAATHLREAAGHINAEQYADSIADSIHAVESVARTICPESKTLGPALKSLEKAQILKHPALKQAFEKLYAYTSDEQGIRHALIEKDAADVGLEEAIFMFGACASFAAYLTQKHRQQAGKREPGAP